MCICCPSSLLVYVVSLKQVSPCDDVEDVVDSDPAGSGSEENSPRVRPSRKASSVKAMFQEYEDHHDRPTQHTPRTQHRSKLAAMRASSSRRQRIDTFYRVCCCCCSVVLVCLSVVGCVLLLCTCVCVCVCVSSPLIISLLLVTI
jgi:hypothetical protein